MKCESEVRKRQQQRTVCHPGAEKETVVENHAPRKFAVARDGMAYRFVTVRLGTSRRPLILMP